MDWPGPFLSRAPKRLASRKSKVAVRHEAEAEQRTPMVRLGHVWAIANQPVQLEGVSTWGDCLTWVDPASRPGRYTSETKYRIYLNEMLAEAEACSRIRGCQKA